MKNWLLSLSIVAICVVCVIADNAFVNRAEAVAEPEMETIVYCDPFPDKITTAVAQMMAIAPAEIVELPVSVAPSAYDGISLSQEDKDLMAAIVWLEARGEPYEGQRMVVEVILNRVLSDRFPNTVEEVIFQKGQFSTASHVDEAQPTEVQYNTIEDSLENQLTIPSVVYFSTHKQNERVYAVIGGHVFCEV